MSNHSVQVAVFYTSKCTVGGYCSTKFKNSCNETNFMKQSTLLNHNGLFWKAKHSLIENHCVLAVFYGDLTSCMSFSGAFHVFWFHANRFYGYPDIIWKNLLTGLRLGDYQLSLRYLVWSVCLVCKLGLSVFGQLRTFKWDFPKVGTLSDMAKFWTSLVKYKISFALWISSWEHCKVSDLIQCPSHASRINRERVNTICVDI